LSKAFRGEVIHIVVGYGAGGGFDLYARFLAEQLGSELDATVVVDNRPGGGGLVALNNVFAAEPDGLTLALINGPAALFTQLLELEGVRYDLGAAAWIGCIHSEPVVLLWSTASPFRTLSDARSSVRPVRFGASGKVDGLGNTAALAAEAFGLDARIIIGYKGSREAALAAIRGEVDGIVLSASTARRLAEAGDFNPVVVLARQRSPDLPTVPTPFEIDDVLPKSVWWLEYQERTMALGRSLLAPPGVPAERLSVLRDALHQVATDPESIAKARSLGLPIAYGSPNELTLHVRSAFGASDERIKAELRRVVLEKYYR